MRKRGREVSDGERLRAGRALERVKTPPIDEETAGSIAERVASPKGDRKRGLEKEEVAETDREMKAPRTGEEAGTKEKVVEEKEEMKDIAAKEASTEDSGAAKVGGFVHQRGVGFANIEIGAGQQWVC